ncbi:MAG: helix-turn-helix transcriptional regulator [Candidatus Bathyarchaeia archaeon]
MKAMTAYPLVLAVLILIMAAPAAEAQSTVAPRRLVFAVYADGYVAVDYLVAVDPTRVRENITLFGSMYQDLTVEDQDGLPLDYASMDGGLTVDTLGSTSVLVSYVTPELTDKSAQIWVFSVSTPIDSNVLLPEGATIVGLNVVPLAMGSLDGSPLLTMPAGDVEVSYTIGIVGTREHALALIKDAESTIEAIKEGGVVVAEAEALLQQAYAAFDAERYAEAELFAGEAKASALNAESEASSARGAMDAASESIAAARGEGRTVGLDGAEELLQQAEDAYNAGNYMDARALAEQSQAAAAEATAPGRPYAWVPVGLGAAALVLAVVALALRRRRPPPEEPMGAVDLDLLFERHPDLRLDDREVIRFLIESGGEAFAAEIRERFGIPRTSAWRMIRRLQREGIVEVRNVRGQSLVRIRPRYREGGGG